MTWTLSGLGLHVPDSQFHRTFPMHLWPLVFLLRTVHSDLRVGRFTVSLLILLAYKMHALTELPGSFSRVGLRQRVRRVERDPVPGSFQWRHLAGEPGPPSARRQAVLGLQQDGSLEQCAPPPGSFSLSIRQRLGLPETYMLGKAEGYACRGRDIPGRQQRVPITSGNRRGHQKWQRNVLCRE